MITTHYENQITSNHSTISMIINHIDSNH